MLFCRRSRELISPGVRPTSWSCSSARRGLVSRWASRRFVLTRRGSLMTWAATCSTARQAKGSAVSGWSSSSEFSRINRATLDVVKAFVSRRSDYYRPAYGRTHKDFPRTCVFVGTTNDPHPLHDRENRRFMPVEVIKADQDWIASNRDQLWGEAVSLFRQGVKWWVY